MIRYSISFPHPSSHLVHVSLDTDVDGTTDLVLPVWTPGSYKIRDFAQHVLSFQTVHPFTKVDLHTWRVRCPAGRLRASWTCYAHELSVRTSWIDDSHAHLMLTNLLMFPEGRKDEPCALEVRAPKGWKTACSLDPAGPRRFVAPDYDTLVDAPVFSAARMRAFEFRVRGKPHRFVWSGDTNLDVARARRDIPRIVEAECRAMKVVPYKRYLFILLLSDDGKGGGLEHLSSTSLMMPRWGLRPDEKHKRFMSLVAHEFFHLWNVKRIRPAALGPFDYGRENFTRLLWAMEGVTTYYDRHFLVRAGLLTPADYLKRLSEDIEKHLETPGRTVQSLADASFDAWIKFYNPGEHSPNATISYYEKGALVSLLLDLYLRWKTKGKRCLDDVLRALWKEYAAHGIGFPERRYEEVCSEVAGTRMDGFFDRFIRGTGELDFAQYFAAVGIRLDRGADGKAWIGLKAEKKEGRTMIATVFDGSPAAKAGLSAGDELIALGGHKVDLDTWEKRLEERKAGERIDVTVFRGSRILTHRVKIGRRNPSVRLRRMTAATASQKALYKSWLGEDWPRR
jgi:predicted metalloprotease with PDZ domain